MAANFFAPFNFRLPWKFQPPSNILNEILFVCWWKIFESKPCVPEAGVCIVECSLLPNNELGSAQHNKRRKQLVTVKFTPISSFKLATSYLVNKCDHLQVSRAELWGFHYLANISSVICMWTQNRQRRSKFVFESIKCIIQTFIWKH